VRGRETDSSEEDIEGGKMILRQSQVRLLLLCILATLCLSFVGLFYVGTKECQCDVNRTPRTTTISPTLKADHQHRLCIIVPFKDRYEELMEFAPYISSFLGKQGVSHEIWVINQADSWRFNRAALINVGFKESSNSCDYIAMHDVDLLPQDPALLYSFPESGPLHIASPDLHPKYDYPTFIGGILLISKKHYQLVDGMSNKYWGWGLEDDEFFVRMRQANLPISRPKGVRSGRKGAFKHVHSSKERARDNAKCYNQRNATRRRDRQTGLSTVFYKVANKRNISIDGAQVNLLDIHLECDKAITPWCNCTGAPPDTNTPDRSRDEDVVVPLIPRKTRPQKS